MNGTQPAPFLLRPTAVERYFVVRTNVSYAIDARHPIHGSFAIFNPDQWGVIREISMHPGLTHEHIKRDREILHHVIDALVPQEKRFKWFSEPLGDMRVKTLEQIVGLANDAVMSGDAEKEIERRRSKTTMRPVGVIQ